MIAAAFLVLLAGVSANIIANETQTITPGFSKFSIVDANVTTCASYHSACQSACTAQKMVAVVNDCFKYIDQGVVGEEGMCACAKARVQVKNDLIFEGQSECKKFFNSTGADTLVESCAYASVAGINPFGKKAMVFKYRVHGDALLKASSVSWPINNATIPNTLDSAPLCADAKTQCLSECQMNKKVVESFQCGLTHVFIPVDFKKTLTSKVTSKCSCKDVPADDGRRAPIPPAKPPVDDDNKKPDSISANWIVGIVAIVVGAVLVVVGGVFGYKRYSANRGYTRVSTA